MLESFIAFNQNAVSNFLYVLSANSYFILLLVGVIGTIALYLKEDVDTAVYEEQNMI